MTRNREWEAGKCVGKRLTENRETDCTIFEKILLVTTNRGCGKMHLCSCDMPLSLSLCFRDISSDNSALQCRLSQVITSRLRAYDSRLRATSRTRVRVINESGARSRSAFPSKRRSEKDGSIWCTARIIRRVNDAAASVGDKQTAQ